MLGVVFIYLLLVRTPVPPPILGDQDSLEELCSSVLKGLLNFSCLLIGVLGTATAPSISPPICCAAASWPASCTAGGCTPLCLDATTVSSCGRTKTTAVSFSFRFSFLSCVGTMNLRILFNIYI
ncbi:hypothetical protein XENOCAPTIV_027825 [Xenoophorus captivus]|uniref:Uncharacterized protein n=1 Tax=Xenoophorus captivus TaxID=1517983 RepID=A0ABV0R2D6_9TELE